MSYFFTELISLVFTAFFGIFLYFVFVGHNFAGEEISTEAMPLLVAFTGLAALLSIVVPLLFICEKLNEISKSHK